MSTTSLPQIPGSLAAASQTQFPTMALPRTIPSPGTTRPFPNPVTTQLAFPTVTQPVRSATSQPFFPGSQQLPNPVTTQLAFPARSATSQPFFPGSQPSFPSTTRPATAQPLFTPGAPGAQPVFPSATRPATAQPLFTPGVPSSFGGQPVFPSATRPATAQPLFTPGTPGTQPVFPSATRPVMAQPLFTPGVARPSATRPVTTLPPLLATSQPVFPGAAVTLPPLLAASQAQTGFFRQQSIKAAEDIRSPAEIGLGLPAGTIPSGSFTVTHFNDNEARLIARMLGLHTDGDILVVVQRIRSRISQ